jgi:hypothetical protein
MWQWQDWMAWLERAQGSLGRALVDWLGGPLEVLSALGVLAWALVVLLAVAAILGAALAELRPWMPTTVDEQEVTLTEAEKTALYGQGTMTELANGSTVVQESSRQRPRWLG